MKKKERISSLGTGGDNIGSLRIVDINLPTIGLESKGDMGQYLVLLEDRLNSARDLLLCHLEILKKHIQKGFLKFFTIGWMHLKMFYLTVGIHGLAESLDCEEAPIGSKAWVDKAKDVLNHVKTFCDEQTEWDFNFEMTPAEGATKVMAKSNKIFLGDNREFYSNQFVPLYSNLDLQDRLRIESELCRIVTGGTMTFVNIDGLPDENNILAFQKVILKTTDIPQFAINIGMTKCNDCQSTYHGVVTSCNCGSKNVTHFTRIVGYFVPVSSWSPVRQKEFKTRHWYAKAAVV